MIIFLIFGLIVGALSVIFALQNIVPITVTFFAWEVQGSLSLVLLLAVLTGVIMCGLFSIPEVIRNHTRFAALKNQKRDLELELEILKKEKALKDASKEVDVLLPPLL